MNHNLIDIIRRFQTHHALEEERARVPVPRNFKVPNEADQTRDLTIPGFKKTNDQQSSQDRREI